MSQPTALRDNRLLTALPQKNAARLLPHLEPVTWSLRTVLYEPDCVPPFLYFPTTAIVSLISTPASGPTAATGVVGCEGVVGVALVMGGASTPSQAMVQMAGGGFQLPAAVGHAEFEWGGLPSSAAALYPGAADPDRADRSLQPHAGDRTAAVPVAALNPRPGTPLRKG
jgi:hypothetical protein